MKLDNANKIVSRIMSDPEHFMVNYSIGNFCNYDCSYCWPWSKTGIYPHRNFNFHNLFFYDLKKQIYERGFRKMTVLYTGGEPTAYKFLPNLIKEYANTFDKIEYNIILNTNFSPGVNYFSKLKKLAPNINLFHIATSFHREYANFEEFSKKILSARDLGFSISIREVVEPETFDYCVDLVKRFEDIGLLCELKLRTEITADFSGKRRISGYTDEMLTTLKEIRKKTQYADQAWPKNFIIDFDDRQEETISEIDFFNENSNVFTGWKCNAGVNHLAVNSNGEIRRCWDVKGKENILGNVYGGTFAFPDSSIICPVTFCTSSTGVQSCKQKIKI